MTVRDRIEAVVRRALVEALPDAGQLKFEVGRPRDKAHGDLATNAAIVAGKALGASPVEVARRIAAVLERATEFIASVEVAGPGFINLTVAPSVYLAKIDDILASPEEACGASRLGADTPVQVEFVSANPTGPLNVVSARAAAVGDALVRLLARVGYAARSEFYVNDAGSQVVLLGRSLETRFRQLLGEDVAVPEGCYPGEYLVEVARSVVDLAAWADRRASTDRGIVEPVPEEASLVEDFLSGPGRLADRAGAEASRVCLTEYLLLRESLPAGERASWAPRYASELSRRPLAQGEVAGRLACLDAYRDWLAGRVPGGAQAPPTTPAAEVFLGAGAAGFDFGRFAVERLVEGQRASLERFGKRPEGGLRFDRWVRESSLRDLVAEVASRLVKDGRFVVEQDGALWLRDPEARVEAEEKDAWVIRRKTGEPTYFLADIAYHVDKRRRGFRRVIDIWGPDHHGHVARMKTAMRLASAVLPDLEIGDDWLEILIAQQVNLVREGKRVQMSKRAGEYVTLDDVVAEVGADAARFFFLIRRSNSHLDFDLDLAKKTSDENPVYYVQYAHARICSVVDFAGQSGLEAGGDLAGLSAPEEVDLIKCLAEFDEVVRASALSLEPHRVVNYLMDLAARFHRFYHVHRVVVDDRRLAAARLSLCLATRAVLRSALGLLGVSAPASM